MLVLWPLRFLVLLACLLSCLGVVLSRRNGEWDPLLVVVAASAALPNLLWDLDRLLERDESRTRRALRVAKCIVAGLVVALSAAYLLQA